MRQIAHLSIRVAWHDTGWNGSVCADPSQNSFCATLDRIREANRDGEQALAGQPFDKLTQAQLPPCKAESGFFMSPRPWMREFEHPYTKNKKCTATHGDLKLRKLEVPAWSAISVPFNWMLRRRQDEIDEKMVTPLPADQEPPFVSPWVFSKERQEALVDHVYGRLADGKSLALFYTKEGHPLGDDLRRLIVGIGRIVKVGKREHYDRANGQLGHPLWDRVITHSIRPDGADGFLMPYHAYLKPTGDAAEDERRAALLREIAVTPPPARIGDFSYGSELTDADVALSVLSRLLAAVRRVREHGIADGPWQEREDWLNAQLDMAWKDRGAFPGTGALLEALGMRLGTALFMELRASGVLEPHTDPWPVLDAIFSGKRKTPHAAFVPDVAAAAPTYIGLPAGRRSLLMLLSRFDLTPEQALRVWDEGERRRGFSAPTGDEEIVANPYLIAERDLGGGDDAPVSLQDIDRGLLPDKVLAAAPPVPSPSAVATPMDPRRVRCALVSVLRDAANSGDSLLSLEETLERLKASGGDRPVVVTTDWIEGNKAFLEQVIARLAVGKAGAGGKPVPALQLVELRTREEALAKILRARCGREIPPPPADWKKLIIEAIEESGGQKVDPSIPRHKAALAEQAQALQAICSRRLSVLTGNAGTGKTSVVGGLVRCKPLRKEGLLLLAPTGKARVRLEGAAGADKAMTVAQFLYGLKRYDGRRQRPLFEGKEKDKSAKTVVIDEASMLTMNDLFAVLQALDLGHVQRIVLVGDPNQLPPIGVGRPFADLISWLDEAASSEDPELKKSASALARLTVEVRSAAGAAPNAEARSDTLRLASWFTGRPPDGDADQVLSRLALGDTLNDLEVAYWNTPQELRTTLVSQFSKHLGLTDGSDVEGFNKSFDFADEGWIRRDQPDGIENWQLLTPTRMHPHGVAELNRWIQAQFRSAELKKARDYFAVSLGDEDIVRNDKVILLRNGVRNSYSHDTNKKGKEYVANGEIGTMTAGNSSCLNAVFAGRPQTSFGFFKSDFSERGAVLELAYALTIHKAQGSQFRTVFVVLPKASRLLSRELVYTALTRSRQRLVLLIEGDDAGLLHDLSRPEKSDACRRNTNLFAGVLRTRSGEPPHAEHLIHRTEAGHMVRSKSELIIANLLHREGISYKYEDVLDGLAAPGRVHPDFTFTDAAGDQVVWEHLGMMDDPDYVRGWTWKREWYAKNGFVAGKTLFTTEERKGQGLDMAKLNAVAKTIKDLVA